jgi:DNA-binding CsgD family transcriptional regulator
VLAHVLPLAGGDLRTRLKPAAVAGAEATATAFGLTPPETRVLASLLAGRTLAETAAVLDIAPSTAKTHLDNIFSKAGVARQADLMRLGTGWCRRRQRSDALSLYPRTSMAARCRFHRSLNRL